MKRNYKASYKSAKGMKDHYESLFKTSVKELQFSNMQIDHLYNALDEIETITNDKLVKQLVKNTKERHQLDKLIHARNLFE